jgi:hypothetical protein
MLLLLFSAIPLILALTSLSKARANIVAALCSAMWLYTLMIHLPMWIEYRFWLPAVPFLIVSASMGVLVISRNTATMFSARRWMRV